MKSQRFFFSDSLFTLALAAATLGATAVPAAGQSGAIAPPATVNTLVSFTGTNGSDPFTENLVQGKDGNIYGTTLSGGTSGNGTPSLRASCEAGSSVRSPCV